MYMHTYMYVYKCPNEDINMVWVCSMKMMWEMGRICRVREEDCPLLAMGERGGLSIAG